MGERFNKTNFVSMQFFQLPVQLYTDEKYRGLSQNSKVAYAIFRNQAQLSFRNGFFEKNGDIYIYYSWKKLEEVMNISRGTVQKILKELEEIGLIERCKQFYNSASKIYVKMLDKPAEDQLISEDICPGNVADDIIKEIQQVNEIANMDYNELSEAMADGRVKSFCDKHLPTVSGSTKNELSECKKYTSGSIKAGSTQNYTPKVQNLNSEGVQKMYYRGSENTLVAQDSVLGSSEIGTQTISNNKKSYTYSDTEVRERLEDRKRGETGARARILEEKLSNPPAQTAVEPDATLAQGHSQRVDSAPVDNFSTGEEAKVAPAQDGFAEVFTLYSENIQANPVPLVNNALRNLFDKHGKDILTEAITQAALSSTPQEKKGFNYVASIVERIAGNKANNFTDYSQVTPAQKVSGNDVKVMPRYSKPVQHSMSESRENIHNMIDSIFGTADEAGNGGKVNDGTDKAGAC